MPLSTPGADSSSRVPSHARQPNKLQKPQPGSRTMELAMEMMAGASVSSARIPAASSTAATRWRAPSKGGELTTPQLSSSSSTSATALQSKGTMPLSKKSRTYITIYDYFRRPAQKFLHPITTIEQYWAIRATIAETRLYAHEVHRQELAALSASHAGARSRDLAELNARYERELTKIKHIVWTILALLGLLLSILVFLMVRYIPTSTSPSKGSVHFTVPILSPFTSVIEHETSAVNVPLVAVLLLSAGISLFLWLRCCGARC